MKQIKPILNFKDVNIINSYRFKSADYTSKLFMHLDAAEEATITYSGTVVTNWQDKINGANWSTAGIISGNPTFTSGNGYIYFGADGLKTTSGMAQVREVLIVGYRVAVGFNNYLLADSGNSNSFLNDLSANVFSNFTFRVGINLTANYFKNINLGNQKMIFSGNYTADPFANVNLIGHRSNGAFPAYTRIFEIMYFNDYLTTAEREKLFSDIYTRHPDIAN